MSSSEAIACGFKGNSDIYGLGIRLGMYLQWTAATITSGLALYPDDHHEWMDTSLMFMIAMLVAVFLLSSGQETTYFVEIFVVSLIMVGTYTTASGGVIGPSGQELIDKRGFIWMFGIRSVVAQIIAVVALNYFSWYWLAGFRNPFQETPCGTTVFLFGPLRNIRVARGIFGAFSLLFAIICSAQLAYCVGMYPETSWFPLRYSPIWRAITGMSGPEDEVNAAAQPLLIDKHNPRRSGILLWLAGLEEFPRPSNFLPLAEKKHQEREKLSKVRRFFADGVPALMGIYCIIGIELTIKWNNISDVYTIASTGQVIPFVIGLLGLVTSVYTVADERAAR